MSTVITVIDEEELYPVYVLVDTILPAPYDTVVEVTKEQRQRYETISTEFYKMQKELQKLYNDARRKDK